MSARPLAVALVVLLAFSALLPMSVHAHPRGVFLRLDDSDVKAHELLEPADVDDALIRNETLAFAETVSGQAIYDWDETITTDPTIAYRMMGTPTSDMASDWLQASLVDMGYDNAYQQVFTMPCVALACDTVPGATTQLENVVGILPGEDLTRWALIGGHYDTREATVGALDNTMGTSTVLHLAERFKQHADEHGPFPITLVFALWDGEEWGLYGSSRFLEDHSEAKEALGLSAEEPVEFVAAMSFDMPGLNWPAQNTWVEYEGGEYAILNLRTSPITVDEDWRCFSYGCYEELKGLDDFEAVMQDFRNYQTLVHVVNHDWLGYPSEWVRVYDDAYGRSDHVPYIAAGIPGMRIQGSHDEEYPHYHRPTDTLENLALLAGGKDLLLQGIETQARAGGSVLYYIARTGDVGHYDPADPVHDEVMVPVGDAVETAPMVAPLVTLLGLALAGATLRRRR